MLNKYDIINRIINNVRGSVSLTNFHAEYLIPIVKSATIQYCVGGFGGRVGGTNILGSDTS